MRTINNRETNTVFPIAIVVSRFNEAITTELLNGAINRLKERDFNSDHITVVWVPGAVEIPLVAQKLARARRHDAIITLGAVIQGETQHFDYVCSQVSDGCARVALDEGVPVIFGVLTTHTEEQAWDRLGGSHGHKGKDAVDAAVEMVATLSHLS